MRRVLVVLMLMAVSVRAEKAVHDSAETAKSDAEQREAAPPPPPPPPPAATSEPTSAPTSAPTAEPRREERQEPPPRTPEPTAEPTRAPQPTAEPRRDLTDAERRHPRPHDEEPVEKVSRPHPTAAPPAAAPAPPSAAPGRRPEGTRPPDASRRPDHDDRDGDRDHDRRPDRGDDRHVLRGHGGPHFHGTVYVPSSCFIEDEPPAPAEGYRLRPSETPATVRLLVDPSRTRVYVDGAEAGAAADFDGPFQHLPLVPGCHDLTLTLDGHRTHVFRLDAVAGRSLRLEHEMRRGTGTDLEDLSGGRCGDDRPVARDDSPPPEARDFELARQGWFLAHGRLTAVVGIARGRLPDRAGTTLSLLTHVEARREGGAVVVSDRESRSEVGRDGFFLASYRIDLAAGRYALRLSVRDVETGRAAATTEVLDVPDLHRDAVSIPSVLLVESMQKAPVDRMHPLRAVVLDDALPVPRFGNVFRPADAPILLFQFSRPAGTAAVLSSYAILAADGTTVAHDSRLCADQVSVAAGRSVGAAAFGPIRFAGLRPGGYRVVATVTDLETLKSDAQQTTFEIDGAERASR